MAEREGWPELTEMVAAYDPMREMVAVLLKAGARQSAIGWGGRENGALAPCPWQTTREQCAHVLFTEARRRIISDKGPQFVARDFKAFIRLRGMTHVRTSSFYPQSNGKIESWHKTLKRECIRPEIPINVADARRIVGRYSNEYTGVRLHSGIGYLTFKDRLKGRDHAIWQESYRRLAEARCVRRATRQADTALSNLSSLGSKDVPALP